MKKDEKIVIYKASGGDIKLDVRLTNETIWLSLNQLADLFERDKSVISRHLRNIYREKELDQNSTVAKNATVQTEGERKISRQVEFYNLDAIISVGYRVNSKKATDFRIWATTTLRDYLTKGYAINEKQLQATRANFLEARQLLLLIGENAKSELLQGHEKDLLGLIDEYAKSLQLLDEFDHDKISIKKTKSAVKFEISYDGAIELVGQMKESLSRLKMNLYLFGSGSGEKLRSAIGAVNQTFDGEDLYAGVAAKAANLFYLVIKDHPFADGNKRIASVLFLYFLSNNNYLYKKTGENKINNSTLTALALLVASSQPRDKETIISLITKLLEEF
jgi:prophage maintenance system killer protein